MNSDKRLHIITKHRTDGEILWSGPALKTWVFEARHSARKFQNRMNRKTKKFEYRYATAEQGPAS